VEEIRGLKATTPIDVQELDESAFRQAVHARQQPRWHGEATRAMWLAFNFAGPTANPETIYQETADEQIVGFYDDKTKSLIIRKPPTDAPGVDDFGPEVILAHEVDHALQDQHFGLARLDELEGDAHLAAAALVEGDAVEVMIAYAARKKGLDPALALSRGAKIMRALPLGVALRLGGHSEKLLEAPRIVSGRLLFPYVSGSVFVERFYQTGGFSLVDRLYAQLPASSAQILHPTQYLAGTLPTPVATPMAPSGYRVLASGTLGELGISVLLSQKRKEGTAKGLANGWRGDAFTIAEGPDGKLVCLWATTWANIGTAAAFEAVVRQVSSAWAAIDATREQPWSLPAGAAVRADGTTVVLVRGLPEFETTAALDALPALVGRAVSSAPPLGALVLAKEPTPPENGATRVLNGRYSNDGLGVTVDIPNGWSPVKNELIPMVVMDRANHTVGMLSFVAKPPPEPRVLDAAFDGVIKSLSATGAADLRVEKTATLEVGWAQASSRTWTSESRKSTIRVLLIPACAGKATYVLTEIWGNPSGEPELDQWARSFDVSQAASSPACMQIHPAP
jgi:hypothetical protein